MDDELDDDDASSTFDDLERRIEELEGRGHGGDGGSDGCATYFLAAGSALAAVISWTKYGSILWGALHALLGWLYVIYVAITR